MQYQTSLFHGQPDDDAIRQIQYFESLALEHDPRGYCICTSEGKDSRVLGHLFRRAGIRHFYLHNITGIDPPELIYFQRQNFRHYSDLDYLTYDVMYKQSMWALMIHKKFPPLRQIRYCCEVLKESRAKEQGGSVICLGVRKKESVGRAKNRGALEIAVDKRKTILLSFDDDDNRRSFEFCYRDHEKRFNPIVNWGSEDIWNDSADVKLEQCCLYREGFERLGCIACPMAREAGRRRELKRWPGFKKLYLRTFQKILDIRIQLGMTVPDHGGSAEAWFEWWLSDKAQERANEDQMNMWTQHKGEGGFIMPKKQNLTEQSQDQERNQATQAQAQAPAQEMPPIHLDVRVRPITPKGNLLGYASVNLNGGFAVDGIKVVSGQNGIFASMPSYQDSNGQYRNVCFPVTKECREQLNQAVIGGYQQALEQMQAASMEARQKAETQEYAQEVAEPTMAR